MQVTSPAPHPAPRTGAGEPHVLLMVAVVLSPRPGRAVAQRGFTALAAHVVQPDGPGARAIVGFAHSRPDPPTTQLPAGHHAVPQIPAVITDRPPASGMPHLQPPGTPVGPVRQTNPERACWWEARIRRGQRGPGASLTLLIPSTHLLRRWGRALAPWMTLENFVRGAQRMAPRWPRRSLTGGPGWWVSPQS